MKWANRIAFLLAVLLASTHLIIGAAVLLARQQDREVIVVTGGSMEPSFSAGDIIVVTSDVDKLDEKDIVTFRSNQGLTTHRIVAFHTVDGAQYVQTKGDANAAPDPDFTPVEAIVGRVDYSAPYLGYGLDFLSSKLGIIVSLCPLLLYILIYELLAIRQVWREEEDVEEAVAEQYSGRHRMA